MAHLKLKIATLFYYLSYNLNFTKQWQESYASPTSNYVNLPIKVTTSMNHLFLLFCFVYSLLAVLKSI